MSIAVEKISEAKTLLASGVEAINADADSNSSIILDLENYNFAEFALTCSAYTAGDVTPFITIGDESNLSDGVKLTDASFNVVNELGNNKLGFANAKVSGLNEVKTFGLIRNKRYARVGFTGANGANLSVLATVRVSVTDQPA